LLFPVVTVPTPVRARRLWNRSSERSMSSLRELLSRVRLWRLWRALRRQPVVVSTGLPLSIGGARPILREVSRQGVRVYSLCGSCGARLSASATLCDACARSRSLPSS
jgi:hypothetical protein